MADLVERLALAYSDGSLGVLSADKTLADARLERDWADNNETNPAHFTDIVKVRVEVIGDVEIHRGASHVPDSSGRCATCGQEIAP